MNINPGRHPRRPNSAGEARRDRIVKYISDYVAQHGYSPTYREISKACALSSISAVSIHLNTLERQGRISRARKCARTLIVLTKGDQP